ncbi:MAG: DciA family protein [Patescibacteria group bacterium]
MKTLKELLPTKRRSAPREFDEKMIFHIAKKAIVEEYGVRGGENIIPVFYKEKKLFLAPRSSLWASEILLQREHLARLMNDAIGTEEIKEIGVARQQ